MRRLPVERATRPRVHLGVGMYGPLGLNFAKANRFNYRAGLRRLH